MKKLSAIILVLCMTFALVACSAQSKGGTGSSGQEASTEEPQQDAVSDDNEEQQDANAGNAAQVGVAETETENTNTESDNPSDDDTGNKVLVAYFSCTGNTEGIAEHVVNVLGADIYEIVPEEAYTDADLNYNDSSSRSTIEQNDDSCRPAISDTVGNMDDYDIVFIGYPIWWGQAPKIIYTFVESYDFSGKTVVPFCTSSSSGVGSSATNLHSSATGANWLDGTRLSSSSSANDIEEWINGLNLDISVN